MVKDLFRPFKRKARGFKENYNTKTVREVTRPKTQGFPEFTENLGSPTFYLEKTIISMFDLVIILIGIGGFGLAGYLDLKYTEFPEWIPYGMLASIITVRLFSSFYTNNFSQLISSLFTGFGFLGIGLLLYLTKQWGDGDAWLLGVLGFFLPNEFLNLKSAALEPYIAIIINFFLLSFVYLVAYSFLIGIRRPDVRRLFQRRILGKARINAILSILFLAVYFLVSFALNLTTGFAPASLYLHILFPFFIVFIVFFYEYAKSVESKLFRRRVSVKQLKAGDVIFESRWRGLTISEIKKLKKKGGAVWIKEGVRFAPVYLLTLLFSIFIGSFL